MDTRTSSSSTSSSSTHIAIAVEEPPKAAAVEEPPKAAATEELPKPEAKNLLQLAMSVSVDEEPPTAAATEDPPKPKGKNLLQLVMSVSAEEKLQLDLQAKWFSGFWSDMHKKHEAEVKRLLSKYSQLSPVVQVKIEDIRMYGAGVCSKCRWHSGCLQCTPLKALRYWMNKAKLAPSAIEPVSSPYLPNQ